MAHEFVLPDIGEGLTEAEIVTWLVAPGDRIAAGDPLCEVETAKAVVEIPSPHTGEVLHLGGAEGDTVAVGAILVVIGETGEKWQPTADDTVPEVGEPDRQPAMLTGSSPRAMPVVRRLARELRVDLATVTGSGPGGRITRDDVVAAADDLADGDGTGAGERLSPTRRAIADHLTRSWREIPHVTTFDDIDASALLEARAAAGESVPIEALMIRAVVPALRAHPAFNATLEGDSLTLHQRYDIGMAVDTQDGLLVPVVRDAGTLGLDELSERVRDLARRTRSRELAADEMQGATFTISNIGTVGGGHGTPIIPLGTTAILSFGKIADAAVVVDGELAVRPTMPLSLSYDHRVIDGVLGRRFIDALAAAIPDSATPVG